MEQRLTFLHLTGERSADGHILARYICSCGNETIVGRSRVANGYTRSCGCLSVESKPGLKHGMRGSRAYSTWSSMLTRCRNANNKDYPRWGGRGIGVCHEWLSFEQFLADMGDRPDGCTIDRIDADGDYKPENCRWATPKQQARNRRDLVIVETNDGAMPLVDYAAKLGITKGAAHLRLKRGTLEGINYD